MFNNVVKVKHNDLGVSRMSRMCFIESVTSEERRTHFNTLNTQHAWLEETQSHFTSPDRISLDCPIITGMLHMQLMFAASGTFKVKFRRSSSMILV